MLAHFKVLDEVGMCIGKLTLEYTSEEQLLTSINKLEALFERLERDKEADAKYLNSAN